MLDKRHDKNENFIKETVLYCMANEAQTLPTVQNYTINISDFGLIHVFFLFPNGLQTCSLQTMIHLADICPH